MKIKKHKNFQKHYEKLRKNEKERVKVAIKLFEKNPNAPELRNHALKGVLNGKRALHVGGDIVVIFELLDEYVHVLFLDIGSHNHVY